MYFNGTGIWGGETIYRVMIFTHYSAIIMLEDLVSPTCSCVSLPRPIASSRGKLQTFV